METINLVSDNAEPLVLAFMFLLSLSVLIVHTVEEWQEWWRERQREREIDRTLDEMKREIA